MPIYRPTFRWTTVEILGAQITVAEDNAEIVCFGDVARNLCNNQAQYESRKISKLGEGLRFYALGTGSYHDIGIHRDDVAEWVRRSRESQP